MKRHNEKSIVEDGVSALDEFESVKEIPTRVNLKMRYPQSPFVIIEKSVWFLLAIVVVLLGYYQLNQPELDQAFYEEAARGVKIVFDYLLVVILILTGIKIIYETLHHLMYNYNIELEHLVITRGVFMRTRASFPIAKINDASLTRNFVELIFGLYSLNILTASPTLTTGTISGLRKKEAVDLQAYLMLLVETTLPQINKEAIGIIRHREMTYKETKRMERGDLPVVTEVNGKTPEDVMGKSSATE
jgi:membrane protein YdbS with pleckstrin-like domain